SRRGARTERATSTPPPKEGRNGAPLEEGLALGVAGYHLGRQVAAMGPLSKRGSHAISRGGDMGLMQVPQWGPSRRGARTAQLDARDVEIIVPQWGPSR